MVSVVRVWLRLVNLDVAQMGRGYDIRARYLRESDVVSGGRMMAKSGLFFWGGSRIEDDFLIAPNTTLPSEAPFWARGYPYSFKGVAVIKDASIGAGATSPPRSSGGRNCNYEGCYGGRSARLRSGGR